MVKESQNQIKFGPSNSKPGGRQLRYSPFPPQQSLQPYSPPFVSCRLRGGLDASKFTNSDSSCIPSAQYLK
ncbi:hypothetical protein ACTXT7_014351 [Hymenolepis weldensis]